jgi:hypothetical protein
MNRWISIAAKCVTALALAGAIAAVGCTPLVQRPARPDAAFSGPRLEKDAFVSFDGARLGLSHWGPVDGDPWAVIIALHGMNSYARAFHEAGPFWARDGIAVYAYYQCGYGRSPNRGVCAGETLLPEDLRYMGASQTQLESAAPGLTVWLTQVFRVMGGYVSATGILTIAVASTSFRSHHRGAAVASAAAGAASIGWMVIVNFMINSDFKWVLLGAAILWACSMVLFRFEGAHPHDG